MRFFQQEAIRNVGMVILNLTLLLAQPTFPNKPNQAPIGGIGILAAAGGSLALKKYGIKRRGIKLFYSLKDAIFQKYILTFIIVGS